VGNVSEDSVLNRARVVSSLVFCSAEKCVYTNRCSARSLEYFGRWSNTFCWSFPVEQAVGLLICQWKGYFIR